MVASAAGPPARPDGRPVPEAVLYRVALSALDSVDGCVAAAACVWADGRLVRAASSHSAAARLVEYQARHGEGPAVAAVGSGGPTHVADVRRERRWPRFTALLSRFGLSSLAVVPRGLGDGRTLTLGFYGLHPDGLRPERTATLLAEIAAARLQQASLVAQGDDLRAAIAGREPIEQAKGMIMQALGCAADEAFDQLRRYSQRRGVRLAELARMLVDDAGRTGARFGD